MGHITATKSMILRTGSLLNTDGSDNVLILPSLTRARTSPEIGPGGQEGTPTRLLDDCVEALA